MTMKKAVRKPLRLWPGVAIVVLQWLVAFGLPFLAPGAEVFSLPIGLLAVLRTIWTFNEFDDIFLLTGGAAGTNVASVQIYNYLTVQRNVGFAAAQSVIMALVLIAMLGFYLLVLRRRGERV